jgi:N6-adenosine-specific RNA methylase IME4
MGKAITIVRLKSVPAAMKALDRLEKEIRKAPTFAALNELVDQARDIQRRWKPVKDVADRAGECWNEAETQLGDELAKVQAAKGTRGTLRGKIEGTSKGKGSGRSTGKAKLAPPVEVPTDADRGIGKRQAARASKLASLGRDARKRLESELKEQDKAVTPNAVLALARQKNKAEKKRCIAAAQFSADGPFDVVVIDPPWDVEKIDRDVRPNQDAFDYPTMTIEQLQGFWQSDIVPRLRDDVHVFWWTTQKYLPAALDLIKQLGLRYVLTMVWHKSGGFQPIDLPQYNCEFIIYARRGQPVFIDTKDFFCCFEAPRREHFRKPDKFYDTVRRVTGGSRIDVFSRERRDDFAQYGNENDRFLRPPEAAE